MTHNKITLERMVNNLEFSHYAVIDHDAQRGFIWNETDIASLGDSIIRAIPIPFIVTMPANMCNLHIDTLPLKISNDKNIESDSPIRDYIVDGQQRITSIANIFLDCDSCNLYYFDLLNIVYECFLVKRDEDVISSSYLDSQEKIEPITDLFCKEFSRKAEPGYRFILASDVLSSNHSSQVNEFLTELLKAGVITHLEFDKYYAYLTTILCDVKHYSIAHTQINSDSNLGFIKSTFKKINSSGYRLIS